MAAPMPDADRVKARTWIPRWAAPEDNPALIALTAACPMAGDVVLCVDRSPDFFALNRLEGKAWRVAVVDAPDGSLAGCMAAAERSAYLAGEPRQVMYVSDLKVHPEYRGGGVADALSAFIREWCRMRGGDHVPTVMTVLGGNAPMSKRAEGPRGLPQLTRFAGIRAHNVALLWKRRPPKVEGITVARAGAAPDLAEMADLWTRIASRRQLAPVHDSGTLAAWMEQAPGLEWSDYWLVRNRDGKLEAFMGIWDQDTFKQMRVDRYSAGLRVFRLFFNLAAPLMGAAPLPAPGKHLRYLTAVNICVPEGRADMLRALLIAAYNGLRGKGHAFFTVGLDPKDPLNAAFKGLMAQPTDIDALVTTPSGRYQGSALDALPLHFEIALV